MQRLAWLLLQLAVIGGVLWLDYDAAQLFDSEPQPGFMIFVGIGLATMLTYGLSRGWDLVFRRARSVRRQHGPHHQRSPIITRGGELLQPPNAISRDGDASLA